MCIPALLVGNRKSHEKKEKAEFEKAMLNLSSG